MSEGIHCCERIRDAIEGEEVAITYISKFRQYGIRILDGGTSSLTIDYCPWCGKKFLPNLRDRWFDELEHLGIDPDRDSVPDEFTDERWYTNTKLKG